MGALSRSDKSDDLPPLIRSRFCVSIAAQTWAGQGGGYESEAVQAGADHQDA
jgi:hypothetical protein